MIVLKKVLVFLQEVCMKYITIILIGVLLDRTLVACQQPIKSALEHKENDQAHRVYYLLAKRCLNTLEKQAKEGDKASELAIEQFYMGCKNPEYQVVHASSQKALNALGMLDSNLRVHKELAVALHYYKALK
jgi:hypothetical protein